MKVVFHPLFIIVLVVSFLCGFGWMAVALLSAVLVHEFSHALVAAYFGVRTEQLRLLPFGAEICIDSAILPTDQKVKILLAGAMGNVIVAIGLSSLLWLLPQFFLITEVLIVANAIPGILNLLPIYPLDGGKILYLMLSKKRWVICWSNAFFGALFFSSCVFFFNIALLLLCVLMIININFDLKPTNYSTYIKTLDKFCVDFMKNNDRIKNEKKNQEK